MRVIIILITFLSLSYHSFSQKIHFTDTTNVWTVIHDDPYWSHPAEYHFNGSAQINGVTYYKLNGMLVREDTVLKKVYCRSQTGGGLFPDTNEVVLYNYNLNVGDSVITPVNNHIWRYGVVSVDSVMINSTWHRLWRFGGNGGSYTVVEGLGAVNSYFAPLVFGPLDPTQFENNEELLCFSNRLSTPVVSPAIPLTSFYLGAVMFNNTTSCSVLGIQEKIAQSSVCVIYPNPANSTAVLNCPKIVQNGSLDVYDLLGRTVYHATLNKEQKIVVGKYLSVPGQYFFRIKDNEEGWVYTGKFIFE